MHHDPAGPHGLPQLVGVQIVEVLDFYDGPLDGLARYEGREYWFSAGPDWVPAQPRPLILHVITAEQADQVRAQARQFMAFAADGGNGDAWERAWEARSTYEQEASIGWFMAAGASGRYAVVDVDGDR
ncbi:hypothetical protein [Micromonospora sp. LH3U1]|uniref:hypothetical protein n=1 Tax=Micromonospora sp. LH3U1 TaxID=3018339 RepID=UPI002349E9E3|nr:hypothetical protein [Micromonospora sp. LH3U1]WCN80998.1 hypothetical protein PCA76_29615 [Micromonospora sp. LH3U1]